MKRFAHGPICVVILVALLSTACEPPRMPASQPATQSASEAPGIPKPPISPTPPAAPGAGPTTTFEQMRQKAQEAYDSARDWASETRDKYWNAARDELNRLGERAKEAASGVKPEIERRLKELQERAADAAKALEKAREAGGQAFEDARKRFEQTVDEYRRAIGGESATQPATKPATAPGAP